MAERVRERVRFERGLGATLAGAIPRDRLRLAYAAVFAAALLLRLVAIGDKPMHHDESIHAWFTWQLVTGEGYEYDPVYHGPLQFYLYTLSSLVFGVGDTAMRAVPTLLGAAMTLLPWFLRHQLGQVAALSAAVLLAFSPSFLYFSRFAREDAIVVSMTLGLIVLTFRFLEKPRRWQPAAIFGLLAASFATKESTYITAFVAGTFFAVAVPVQAATARRRGRPVSSAPVVEAILAPGRDAWIWALTSFALVFTLLFSSFLLNPQGLRDGLYDSWSYWLLQHPVNRGDQPWFYYLAALPAYELPVVVLAVVGIVASFRRPTLLRLFLVWDAALSLAAYSWAGERMPWLVLHPLLPLVLLAGLGVSTIWPGRRRVARRLVLAAAPLAALVLVQGAASLVYRHPADPAELLVFTQTSVDVPPVRDRIVELYQTAKAAGGGPPRIAVDAWGGTGWPWAWYLRDLPVAYIDMSGPVSPDDWDVILVAEPNAARVGPLLRDFSGERFRLREWWVVDWGAAEPTSVWRWFRQRDAWSPKGTMDEYLYVRAGLSGAAEAVAGTR